MLSSNLYMSLFVVVIFAATAHCDWNPCQGRRDGDIVQIGCRSYSVCVRGTPTVYNCTGEFVYDRDLKRCVRISENRNACGQPADCSGKLDGYYPDVLYGCSTFYGCTSQQFVGRLYCDANLVYNQQANACGYAYQVPPPCGTKI
ncbi:uncharacterized protein LOC131953063 [Physella acuta]|uniref:uncharacterized protein LOC131953063 n=1 Tax=Physella acuta TaxID=109671 RepID=UPI0027DD3628|nr:uncharacterized protein LOC131953063 [Physella acuta]